MRYMLLIKATRNYESGALPDETQMSEMAKFKDELVEAGALIGCERLHPSSRGMRIRYSGGNFVVTDGPFAETKELIAGYCMIQAKSLAEAIGWAERVPVEEGEVEVRPLFELEDFPVDASEQSEGWREKEEQFRAAPPPQRRPGTTRYMGLLKADPDTEAGVLPDPKLLEAMGAFMEEGIKAGVILSGEGLQPSSKSARVRYSRKDRLVIDGPFAETKELVAGYALLQFATRAEAIDWTKRFVQVDAPGRHGAECECELRQVFEFDEFAPGPSIEQFRRAAVASPQ